METWGIVILLVGAVVIGFAMAYSVERRFGYEGVLDTIGAAIGGFVASEYLGSLSDWGAEWYGLRIFPALIGAVILAAIVELVTYFVEHRGRPARA